METEADRPGFALGTDETTPPRILFEGDRGTWLGAMQAIQGDSREACAKLVEDYARHYSEDVFPPVPPRPEKVSRDRVSAQMARRLCRVLADRIRGMDRDASRAAEADLVLERVRESLSGVTLDDDGKLHCAIRLILGAARGGW